jgi:hypothetical protein
MRTLLAVGVLCCWVAVSPSLAQQPSVLAPPDAGSMQGPTLHTLAPGLSATTGSGNPSYAELVRTAPAARPAHGARIERFTAPDGKLVTVSIAAPSVEKTYQVPPIQPGENPAVYFTNAVRQAGQHATIVFPKGQTYDFSPALCSKEVGAHVQMNSPTDVVIDGNGAVLNFTAPCGGMTLVNPTRVVVKNFVIDWPTLQIASLGTIVSSSATGPRRNTYDLQIDSAYVRSTMPQSYKAINAWDADHGWWSLQHTDEVGYNPRQPLSAAGEARNVQSWAARFAPGERVLVRHYTLEGNAIDILHGQDVTLQDVTIYSSPGFGIAVLQGSSGFAISNCKVTRAPGRLISTAADALHIANHAGDVLIENNTFAFQGDDGLNMLATIFPVANGGTNEISVPVGFMKQGDPVALFTAEMHFDDSAAWKIVDITPGATGRRLTLDHAIPQSDKSGFLADLNYAGARYIVRNNQFLHNRARGILLQTSYGLVEGNTFAGQTMHALFLTTFPLEGPGAENVTIAGNSISGGGVNGGLGAVVLSRERNVYGQPAHNPPVHQNLIFMDNHVNDVPGPAFYISSANNVVLYRNTVRNTNSLWLENKWNGAGDVNFPVVINNASNVLLRRNAIGAIPSGRSAVFVDKATTRGVRISAD